MADYNPKTLSITQDGNTYTIRGLTSAEVTKIQNALTSHQDISGKADKTGTVLETTLSRGRKENTTVGTGSIAFGYNVTSSADYSHAEGYATTASGNQSHAEGNSTTASGSQSHAEGVNTTASGNQSHAEGISTTASNASSHAEGYSTTASGEASHTEGGSTRASGNYSHAEGWGGTYTYNNTTYTSEAQGMADHIEGYQTRTTSGQPGNHAEGFCTSAIGGASHSEGNYTTASANGSHAEGNYTIAGGQYSHAEGSGAEASGNLSHAEGDYTHANGRAMHAQGIYNAADSLYPTWTKSTSYAVGDKVVYSGKGYSCKTANSDSSFNSSKWNLLIHTGDAAFVIGNGTSSNTRSNAFLVKWDGSVQEGSATASGVSSHAEGTGTTASGSYSHVEGAGASASGSSAHAEGSGTAASGYYAHAEGAGATASGSTSHAEGAGTTACGAYAHAEGASAIASGAYSHAEGGGTTASGDTSHAEGSGTMALGCNEHVSGQYNVPDSAPAWVASTSYAVGDLVSKDVTFTDSSNITRTRTVIYKCKTANSDASFTSSKWSEWGQYLVAVGNGLNSSSKSNAYTLDWDGNERIKGDLYVGCNADSSGGTKVAKISDLSGMIVVLSVTATSNTSTTISDSAITADHYVCNQFSTDTDADVTWTTSAGSITLSCTEGIPAMTLVLCRNT